MGCVDTLLLRKLKLDWSYALGEFVIVLMGVLVALAFDGLLEARADREIELQYLEALASDIERDLDALDVAIARAETRALLGEQVLGLLDDGPMPPDPSEVLGGVHGLSGLSYPQYSRATIDDLVSTGNLELLRDRSLKNRIASYYALIDYHDQFRTNWRGMQLAFEQTLPDLIDLPTRTALLAAGCPPDPGQVTPCGAPEWWWGDEPDFDSDDARDLLRVVMEHPVARGQLENMARIQGTQHVRLSEIRTAAEDLLAELRRGPNAS